MVVYGRGQSHFAKFWNYNSALQSLGGAKVYFPPCKMCDQTLKGYDSLDESTDNQIPFSNKPLALYLPESSNKIQPEISIYTTLEKKSINIFTYNMIKSEMKLRAPSVQELIKNKYTCESLNLRCSDLNEYDFNEDKEWVDHTEIKFFLRSEDNVEYEIRLHELISNTWNEFIGYIENKLDTEYKNVIFNELIIRNYGTMPVYVLMGNTMFLKKEPIYIVKNGVIQNNFYNWSWHQSENGEQTYFADSVYDGDPESKNGVKFEAKIPENYAYYAHSEIPIGVPEAVSFKIRPLNDIQFRFKIDDKIEYNLTSDYLVHRNCKIPVDEESEILIDVRSLVYSNPTYLLNNDISGFFLQTISDIDAIKERLSEEKGKEAADSYTEVLYFYDFVMHNTYPEDPYLYSNRKLDEEKEQDCIIRLEDHYDWGDSKIKNKVYPVVQWPDDVDLDYIK